LQQSDEEVLGYSSPSEPEDDDDDDMEPIPAKKNKKAITQDDAEDEQEDEMGAWGESKQDYYNADVIETEQDALDEEKEALRLQKKQLQAMSAADFGFDEADWQQDDDENIKDDSQDGDIVTEVLPQLELDESLPPKDRLKLLKTRYPEFEPLSKELLALHQTYQHLSAVPSPSTAIKTKLQAAAAYLASLTMYFALLTSTADDAQTNRLALSASAIRNHPVMDSLVQCRDLWTRLKDLPESDSEDDMDSAEEEDQEQDMSDSEIEQEAAAAPMSIKKSKKTSSIDATTEARRAERLRKTEADFADLDALLPSSSRPKKSSSASKKRSSSTTAIDQNDSDLGEDTSLTTEELAAKASRKKSLRFYTSQIAQKANKRGARIQGGDEDVPHRERLRDRQERLNAEAEARARRFDRDNLGDELGGDSEDEVDRAVARQVRGEDDDDDNKDDYYDMISSRASKKKEDKAAEAAAYKLAAASGGRVVEKQELGPDGKRAITYAIEKNKGLTPHRKKDVRNPRVKKRKKFEEKKKKLASIKPVYKGGEGKGGYGGELTGIKKGLVRSTKL
jgi:U3 small nucleolar RNA-associated protein 3